MKTTIFKRSARAFYANIGRQLLNLLPPEAAHRQTIKLMQSRLAPRFEIDSRIIPRLTQSVAGLNFRTPLGLAAGFDKNAETVDAMLRLGFSFVEAGAVTPERQAGNPAPRVFRLREDRAVINRYGFNNDGLEIIRERLKERRKLPGTVGINLGTNKDSEDKIEDYIKGLETLAPYVDFCTINISSPNTPGLRTLQDKSSLEDLLRRIFARKTARTIPLFLKISPDINEAHAQDILHLIQQYPLSALIISNTTIARPGGLVSRSQGETGGLSGKPLFDLSTRLLRDFARELKGALPLIGVGGISSPREAYLKILAGASLIQLYTALIYEGPQLPYLIINALPDFLDADGFSTITEAIGADI